MLKERSLVLFFLEIRLVSAVIYGFLMVEISFSKMLDDKVGAYISVEIYHFQLKCIKNTQS